MTSRFAFVLTAGVAMLAADLATSASAWAEVPPPAAAGVPPPPVFVPLTGRAVCRGSYGYASAGRGVRTFLWRLEALELARRRAAADPYYAATLRKRADAALDHSPYSVTQKTSVPPEGSTNDYASIGPYWWPAAGKPDGLPYERRDGKVNPQSRDESFDKVRMRAFGGDVTDLALAWYLWGDKRHADKAAALLRVWFLDPASRMNPSLNFAQAVPGRSIGRAEGMIELGALTPVVEAIGLLGPSGALTAQDQAGLESWFGKFVNWMRTSPIALAERAKTNNHGMFYDLWMLHFALFARLEPVATDVARDWPTRRLAVQVAADGSLHEELSRTRSLHYSFFAMEAATKSATLAECVGLDLWHAKTRDGRGLETALAFLMPYARDPASWTHPEQALEDGAHRKALHRQMAEPLRLAAWGTGSATYEAAAAAQGGTADAADPLWLPPLPTGGS